MRNPAEMQGYDRPLSLDLIRVMPA